MTEEEKKELNNIQRFIRSTGLLKEANLLLKLQKELDKKDKVIDLMAEEILRIDTAKSKFEYDHAKKWDTEKGIKKYFNSLYGMTVTKNFENRRKKR